MSTKKVEIKPIPKTFKLLNFTTKVCEACLDPQDFAKAYLAAKEAKDMIEVQLPDYSVVEEKELTVKDGVVHYCGQAIKVEAPKVHPLLAKKNDELLNTLKETEKNLENTIKDLEASQTTTEETPAT